MVRSLFRYAAYSCLITCATCEAVLADDPKAKDQAVVRNENTTPPSVPSGEGWTSLFSGKDLAGWTQRNGWAVYRINGKLVEDIIDPQSFMSGFIGLQVHGIGKDQGPFNVKWRKIEIRDLSKK